MERQVKSRELCLAHQAEGASTDSGTVKSSGQTIPVQRIPSTWCRVTTYVTTLTSHFPPAVHTTVVHNKPVPIHTIWLLGNQTSRSDHTKLDAASFTWLGPVWACGEHASWSA